MWSRRKKRRRTRPQTQRRLAVQQLETRRLMAIDMPFQLPVPDPVDMDWIEVETLVSKQQPIAPGSGSRRAAHEPDVSDVIVGELRDVASPKVFETPANGESPFPKGRAYAVEDFDAFFTCSPHNDGPQQGPQDPPPRNGEDKSGNQDAADENDESNQDVMGPARGGLLGPGGVVDQNGAKANAHPTQPDNNRQPDNNDDSVMGPARGGLLGPGGVVDQNGAKANAKEAQPGNNPQRGANAGPVMGPERGGLLGPGGKVDQNGAEVNGEKKEKEGPSIESLLPRALSEHFRLQQWFDGLLENMTARGIVGIDATIAQPSALRLGYMHGRMMPFLVNPFATPWLRAMRAQQKDAPSDEGLPEILRDNPIGDVLRPIELAGFGLDDLDPEDFDDYTRGLALGLRDAFASRR